MVAEEMHAFGLRVRLLDGPCSEAASDLDEVRVRRRVVQGAGGPAGPDRVSRQGADVVLQRSGVGRCRVSDAGIELEAEPGALDHQVRAFVLGVPLALWLRSQGSLVLHGSAVAMGGAAVSFVGAHGWGKSTLAAMLQRRGHAFVSDGATIVDASRTPPAVRAGPAEWKLRADSLRSLGAEDQGPLAHPALDKRLVTVSGPVVEGPVALKVIYVLADGDEAAIEPMRPAQATMELVRHTYAVSLLGASEAPHHLRACAAVTGTVPVRRLTRRLDMNALPQLASMVENDVAKLDLGSSTQA